VGVLAGLFLAERQFLQGLQRMCLTLNRGYYIYPYSTSWFSRVAV